MKLFRIEDRERRGPYRPGCSALWSDIEGPPPPPPWAAEFGICILAQVQPGENMQCGFKTETQLRRWFTPAEIYKLQLLGYRIVEAEATRIIAESKHQVVFIREGS